MIINRQTQIFLEPFTALKEILSLGELRLKNFLFASFLAFLAAFFEGLTYKFLVPTINVFLTNGAGVSNKTRSYFLIGEESIIFLLGIVFMFSIVRLILQYSASLYLLSQIRKFAHQLRSKIFLRFTEFGKAYHDQRNSGELYQLLMGYTQEVALFLNALNQSLFKIFALLIYLYLLFSLSFSLALLVVILFPIMYSAIRHLIIKIKHLSFDYIKSFSQISRWISDILDNLILVRVSSQKKEEYENFNLLSSRLQLLQFKMDKTRLLIGPLQEAILLAMFFVFILVIFSSSTGQGSEEISKLVVFLLVLRRSSGSIGFIGDLHGGYAQIQGPLSELKKIFVDQDKHIINDGKIEIKEFSNNICFDNVSFSYPNGRKVLHEVSFIINKGDCLAIIGPSGAGKTTIVNLFLSLYYPTSGTIRVDGVSLEEIKRDSWYSQISIVSQNIFLFNQSLRANLVYGLEGKVSDERLSEVLEIVGLGTMLKKFPGGLEGIIAEQAVNFSGGEKQRISIARAILRDRPIVLLDEATSALDKETGLKIQETIERVFKDKTVFIIAHKLSTIKAAKKIILISEGKLVAEGKKDELLRRSDLIKYLYLDQ